MTQEFQYPARLCLVVKSMEDYKDLTTYRILREFCEDIKIGFMIRDYDAQKFSEDRKYIEKLPSLHLYTLANRTYIETFYPEKEPFQDILNSLLDLEEREKDAQRRRQIWKNRIGKILPFLKSKPSAEKINK
jgi:hypothetical protein